MSRRLRPRLVILVALLVLAILLALVGLASSRTPHLLETIPADGSQNVPAAAPLRLTFSVPMDADSLVNRLTTDPVRDGNLSWEGNTLIFTPNQPWPNGRQVTVRLAGGARAATGFAFGLPAYTWTFTTSQSLLAYLWPSSGPADLYALDPLTGDIQPLTMNANILDYTVAFNGLAIYYSTSNLSGGADIFRLDRMQLSSTPQLLVSCGTASCRSPAISPDNLRLAYEYVPASLSGRRLPSQVWLLNLAGGDAAPVGDPAHETYQPVWSSTGRLAYYDQTSLAYILYDPVSQTSLSLPNQTGLGGTWSPDGRTFVAADIYYVTLGPATEMGISRLLRYDIATGAATDLSQMEFVEDAAPVFSPQGTLIAFARKYLDSARWSLGRPLWFMNADGSEQRQVMSDVQVIDYDFAWSPDGSQLAFVRFDQGAPTSPPELWLVKADGTEPLELVIGGYSPQWIP
jgi:Tol biopolymer transport system component